MAHDDPTREDTARPKADTAATANTAPGSTLPPAAAETTVADVPRTAPEGTMDDPLPPAPPFDPEGEKAVEAPAEHTAAESGTSEKGGSEAAADAAFETAQPMLIPPPAPASRGASPWLSLLLGALGGAVVAALVAYGLSNRLGAANVSDELQPLVARVGALEARGTADPRALAALAQRVDKLDAAAAAQPAPEQARALITQAQADIAALRQAQQGLQGGVKDAATAAAGASQQTAALAARIDKAAASMDAMSRAGASVTVLAALKEAIVSGRPFATELDAARAVLGPTAGALDPFAAMAATGYSAPAKLAQRVQQAAVQANASAPAAAAAPSGGSVMDRLLSSAESLVKVRPAETVPAPQDQALLDQAVGALRAGDLDTALGRLDALPQVTKDKLKSLIAEIQDRRNAADAVGALYLQALAAISGKVP
ncbi:hypothetical protein V5F77_01575 [Xanthobacter sp. DSM 24535]|uniref:COG4223 family protein n=1 Tax=Roseixanthobacter psychrophilus TaxID=3119917 RepID=UPI00372BF302